MADETSTGKASDRSEFIPYAVIRAFQDALSDYVKDTRSAMFADLVERYEEDGSKSWDIPLPGDDKKVATLSLSFNSSEPTISNRSEFTKWAQWNAPDLVKEQVVPESREWVAKSTALQSLMDDYDAQVTDDGELVTKDGEPIPGVTVPKSTPKTFGLRWSGDGKKRVERAYGDGLLNDRLLDTPMPLIDEGGDQE